MPQKFDIQPVFDIQPFEESSELEKKVKSEGDTYKGPDTFWGGVLHSLRPGGESDIAALKGFGGFLKGAITDIPSSISNLISSSRESRQNFIPPTNQDISLNPMEAIHAALQQGKSGLAAIGDVTSQAGSHPVEFGRMMGQLTGQPAVTTGLMEGIPSAIKGIPKIPVRNIVRSAGPYVEGAGNAAMIGSSILPGHEFQTLGAGYGLRKLGGMMKNIESTALTDTDALRQFYGGNKPAPAPPTPEIILGKNTDPFSRAQLPLEENPSLFTPRPNELTMEFNRPIQPDVISGEGPLFEQPEIPSGQNKLPFYEPHPESAPLGKNAPNSITLQEPTPLKIQEQINRGYTPRETLPDGGMRMTRVVESTPVPESTTPTLPNTITKKFTPFEVDALKSLGYKPVVKNGKIVQMIKKGTERLIGEELGIFDWKEMYQNLKQMLGRDPSVAEIEEGMSRQVPEEGGLDVSKLRQQNVLGQGSARPEEIQLNQQSLPTTSSLIKSDPMTTNLVETIQQMGNQPEFRLNRQVKAAQNLILKSMNEILTPEEIRTFHQLADMIQDDPNLPKKYRTSFKFDQYQLPDGTIINVDSTASKSQPTFDFQMKGGKTVKATRLMRHID